MFQYLFILANLAVAAWAMPNGAPEGACTTFMPDITTVHGDVEQPDPTPYSVLLNGFPTAGAPAVPSYVPGGLYPGNIFSWVISKSTK